MLRPERINAAIERIMTVKHDILGHYEHTCQREFCNPQNEEEYIAVGMLEPPAIDPDVYICKFGKMHYCTRRTCKHYLYNGSGGICDISGARYVDEQTSYVRAEDERLEDGGGGDSGLKRCRVYRRELGPHGPVRTLQNDNNNVDYLPAATATTTTSTMFGNVFGTQREHKEEDEEEKKVKNAGGGGGGKESYYRIRDVVTQVFYGPARAELNRVRAAQAIELAERNVRAYDLWCRKTHTCPNRLDKLIILANGHLGTDVAQLEELEYDEGRVAHYTRVLLELWEWFRGTPYFQQQNQGCRVHQLALGALYLMRQGYRCGGGVEVLPCDPFMVYLPTRSDLDYFTGMQRRDVSNGEDHLRAAYASAVHARWPVGKLRLKSLLEQAPGMYSL